MHLQHLILIQDLLRRQASPLELLQLWSIPDVLRERGCSRWNLLPDDALRQGLIVVLSVIREREHDLLGVDHRGVLDLVGVVPWVLAHRPRIPKKVYKVRATRQEDQRL